MRRELGVCYYPEHWQRESWKENAQRMVELGLSWVRIGEFAWSRLEPMEGDYQFEWLDEAIQILGNAGLKVVLGTPTATPPRWMLCKHPDMLAVDANGNPKKFGSRRHYCFSHTGYQQECEKIVSHIAQRYSQNPHIHAWQTDNEYSCHDTAISYSLAARDGFQVWLKTRYGDIDALNQSWGNVFWSMEYSCFAEIDLPNLTVTEPNPSHILAFRRYSSDQVVRFNKLQTEMIRQYSKKPITHNFMGRITDFDHFKVGDDLDFASWDSYPLGFLEDRVSATNDYKARFSRQGECDFQAFHHDLYRSVGKGRWWVMEQQPGPVNWAPYNPIPHPGMVKLWTWEAFAHGAEVVSYFRWQQVPFAQEQLHSGLLRPDGEKADAFEDVRAIAAELKDAPEATINNAPVAILFNYDADFSWTTQPHGKDLNYFELVFDTYRTLRSLGLSIDILPQNTDTFDSYKVIFVPGLIHMSDGLKSALSESRAISVIGPRSGARDEDMKIPIPLPPDLPGFDCTVTHLESLRPDSPINLENGGSVAGYREIIETTEVAHEKTSDGHPVLIGDANLRYIAAMLDDEARKRIFKLILTEAGLETIELPDGVRTRETETEKFWFNYDSETHEIAGLVLAPASYIREPKEI